MNRLTAFLAAMLLPALLAAAPPAPPAPAADEPPAAASAASAPAIEPPASDPAELESSEAAAWSISFSAYTYIVADEQAYIQPTLAVDHDWLHLEARYNYENRDTSSVWMGYNFSFGEDLTLELTPMLGGVFGETTGVAPGYEFTVGWKGFELYSEGEFVIDTEDSSESFFYTWSELSYSPVEWFRAGIVIQRTRAYETDFDIQRGLLVGLTFDTVSFTAYVFNPDESDPTVVLGLSVEF